MFTAPPTAALTSQPRQGFGARVAGGISRFGAALRSVVAGGLRRPQSGPDSRTGPATRTVLDADSPLAAKPVRAPRRSGRPRKGGLARLFGRRPMAAVPEQSCELPDFDLSEEACPGLSPEARAFFNTPLEECDPEVLGVVLEALAGLIAGSMTPREGMRDMRDVFLALSSRMEAVSVEAVHAPPDALPEVAAAPAEAAASTAIEPAAIDPQAASFDLPGQAPRQDSATLPSDAADAGHGAAAAVSAAPDQTATAPAGPQASGVSVSGTSTQDPRALDSSRVLARHAQRRLFRERPGFATRSRMLPRRNIVFRR
jgi:hypothetical protein